MSYSCQLYVAILTNRKKNKQIAKLDKKQKRQKSMEKSMYVSNKAA